VCSYFYLKVIDVADVYFARVLKKKNFSYFTGSENSICSPEISC
jgi:hypothetical protein